MNVLIWIILGSLAIIVVTFAITSIIILASIVYDFFIKDFIKRRF